MLKTVLVGCGLIAQTKHLPALHALRRKVRLAAVCDTNIELAKKLADQYKIPRTHASLTEALSSERPDLVILCTPPQTHPPLSLEALAGGAHLLLEKPMALTAADSEAIQAAAQKAERQLSIAFSQSFTPVVLEARRWIKTGKIGQLQGMEIFLSTPANYMTTRKDHWVHRLPGGVLSETGPHVVHLALSFLGKIQKTAISTRKHQNLPWSSADDFRILLSCEQGTCAANLLYTTRNWAARVDLIGEKSRLTLDLESGTLIHIQRPSLTPISIWGSAFSESAQLARGLLKNTAAHLFGRRENSHALILEHFIQSIEQGSAPPVAPQEGVEVARTLETLNRQLEQQQ